MANSIVTFSPGSAVPQTGICLSRWKTALFENKLFGLTFASVVNSIVNAAIRATWIDRLILSVIVGQFVVGSNRALTLWSTYTLRKTNSDHDCISDDTPKCCNSLKVDASSSKPRRRRTTMIWQMLTNKPKQEFPVCFNRTNTQEHKKNPSRGFTRDGLVKEYIAYNSL